MTGGRNPDAVRVNRKSFLRMAASAAAGAAFPAIRASAASPNSKVNVAFVGIGGRGKANLDMFAYYSDYANIVAFCDVEIGGEWTLKAREMFPDVPRYSDFRKMFDEMTPSIDAVCISTPDFSHFPAAMLAMSLGKAVYCEKPLCNSFAEAGLMAGMAKRSGVVTQMGNQGHSDANYWQCRELVANGFLSDVVLIKAHMCGDRRWHAWNGRVKTMPGGETPPPDLDWNLWQSQREERSFSNLYVHGNWRCFYEYGTGALGDWAAHIFDAPWECLDMGLPEKIEVVRDETRTEAVYPMASILRLHFPARGKNRPPCVVEWYEGKDNMPAPPEGVLDAKWEMPLRGCEIYTADGRVFARGSHGAPMTALAGIDPKDPETRKKLSGYPRGKSGHYLNFLKAVRGEEKTNSPFETSGPLTQVLALGAIAQRLGEKELRFSRKTMRFIDNDRANACLSWPVRKGWEEFARL